MGDDLNIAVVLTLLDQFTQPMREAMDSVQGMNEAAVQQGQTMAEMGTQMQMAGAMTTGAGIAMKTGLERAMTPAIQFESQMADIRKVVDFPTPAAFQTMQQDILALSAELPVAVGGLQAIVEAAGQSGIAQDQLLAFAEDAAVMGTAFDMAAGQAGQSMAAWRAGMGLSQDEVVRLANMTNHLSNSMNAQASAISNVITRQGAAAQTAGLQAQETAALSAALLSSGQSPEIVATALKNLTGSLTAGEAATGRQKEAFQALGLNAQQMAAAMQEDAQGAITRVFQALSAQPAEKRGSLVSLLFGEESKGAIAPLLANMENLRTAFRLMGEDASGSMLAEFQNKAGTTQVQLQQLNNQLDALKIAFGQELIPVLQQAIPVFADMVQGFVAFAEAHPMLVRIGMVLAAISAASLLVIGPLITLGGAFMTVGGHALWAIGKISPALTGMVSGFRVALAYAGVFGSRFVAFVVPAFRAAMAAVWAFNAALFANPIVWIIGAIVAVAAAAWLLVNNWDQVTAWLTATWQGIVGAFQDGFLNGILHLLELFNPAVWVAKGVSALIDYLFGVDLYAIGSNWIGGLVDGIADRWQQLVAWLTGAVRDLLGVMPDWVLDKLGLDGLTAEVQATPVPPPESRAAAESAREAMPEAAREALAAGAAARAGNPPIQVPPPEAPEVTVQAPAVPTAPQAPTQEALRARIEVPTPPPAPASTVQAPPSPPPQAPTVAAPPPQVIQQAAPAVQAPAPPAVQAPPSETRILQQALPAPVPPAVNMTAPPASVIQQPAPTVQAPTSPEIAAPPPQVLQQAPPTVQGPAEVIARLADTPVAVTLAEGFAQIARAPRVPQPPPPPYRPPEIVRPNLDPGATTGPAQVTVEAPVTVTIEGDAGADVLAELEDRLEDLGPKLARIVQDAMTRGRTRGYRQDEE